MTEQQGQEVFAKLKQINNFAKNLGINILKITVNTDFIDKENCFSVNNDFLAD